MSNTTKIIIGAVVAIIVIWAVAALLRGGSPSEPIEGPTDDTTTGDEEATTDETGPIRIGFIGPLTGDASSVGTVNKAGVEVAVDEINADGGIDGRMLEVIYEDGQCNATEAVNAANKLINVDGVSVIIGGLCSTETSAFGPLAMENGVVVFSYGSSAPSLSSLGEYFFRSYPSDAFQGKFGAEYMYTTLEARKVAIVYHISEWGTGIKDVFEENFTALGGEVVAVEGVPQEARDYRTILTKIKDLDIDYIYFPAYPDGTIAALTQAGELGITMKMLGADAWDDPKVHTEVSGKGDFLYIAPVTVVLPDDFKAKVIAKTGGDQIPIGTPQAYDNVKLIAQIMREVGTDPDAIRDALREVEYDGVSGKIFFDENGDLERVDYVVKRIQDGTALEVE